MAFRSLVIGTLSVALALMTFAEGEQASAATGKPTKKCVSVKKPKCSLTEDPVCAFKDPCGCQAWICQPRRLSK